MDHSALDLAPARWIWLPGERCLPGTFVLFRRELTLTAPPRGASGWVVADSRYRLTVNGQRVQWGPAPCDPRWQEADPLDLAPLLGAGPNVIGVEVCYFGQPDGTWPLGSPGLLLRLEIEQADGRKDLLVTDAGWRCAVDRAHPPGRARRWFLRALQEEFDARLHPAGWDAPGFAPGPDWLPARELPGRADRPSVYAGGPEYTTLCDEPAADYDLGAAVEPALRPRSIPLLRETWVPAARLVDSGRVAWRRDPRDWFDFRVPGSFTLEGANLAQPDGDGAWRLPATPGDRDGVFATFAQPEIMAGFPGFTIDAPAGTVVELAIVEAADPGGAGPRWLDHQFFAWSRFVCREGENCFGPFDYESGMFLQLHVRGASRPVRVSAVGMRRREFPWREPARCGSGEPALQRLFGAAFNTLRNSCLETNQDGAARERQQYAGDCGHQARVGRWWHGDPRHAARYLRTFSEGLTLDGYFLDCWPAADRLARIPQRELGLTRWGPILDHSVGLAFDTWHHVLDTDDRDTGMVLLPRLRRFFAFLLARRDTDRLLPVAGWGVPSVWIDHDAFARLRHKQAAFNLYAAAALRDALAPLARLLGDEPTAALAETEAAALAGAAAQRFWCRRRRVFVNNLPWEGEEGGLRLDDRSLATAVLHGLCPGGDTAAAVAALADPPAHCGLSYPANAGWRLLALARAGRADVVARELRTRWAGLTSVRLGHALQESWHARLGTTDQFSHCPIAPLTVLGEGLVGLRPLAPGFARYAVRPQLADLGPLDLVLHTPRGPLGFRSRPLADGRHAVRLETPAGATGALELAGRPPQPLPAGSAVEFEA